MINFKYLQKLFLGVVMGFSLSFMCVACGDDEGNEQLQDSNKENEKNETIPPAIDSIPSINGNTEGSIYNNIVYNINGHEAVDLGLSVLWATCNVDANSPKECGGYYAWGEIKEKNYYEFNTYKWYSYESGGFLTKYNSYDYLKTDNKLVLDSDDDVAHLKWGDSWRMPTLEEVKELVNNCVFWRIYGEIEGVQAVGTNHNSIFFPLTGFKYRDEYSMGQQRGYYWTATRKEGMDIDDENKAYYFDVGGNPRYYQASDIHCVINEPAFRWNGHAIRPVCDKRSAPGK